MNAKAEQADAGDPWGCAVVGFILFRVLSVCGVPLPGRLILGVIHSLLPPSCDSLHRCCHR